VRAGCDAFLDLTQDSVVRQIMLTDAPSVLGWEKWREIDERRAFGLIKAALEPAAKDSLSRCWTPASRRPDECVQLTRQLHLIEFADAAAERAFSSRTKES
jgi:hypothetical protein